MSIRFATVCSGIEAPSMAFAGLGWQPVFFSEIEAFPKAVLAARHPGVPDLGDMREIDGRRWRGKVDVFVAGTPCVAFSIAGMRRSLSDDRGNLTLIFARLCNAINPPVILWENVPGVLSTKDNAFGCFLAALAGEDDPLVAPGKRWQDAGFVFGPSRTIAWRCLDAQYANLAQRRKRVFVVACPVGGADPREILFEREGVRRDSPPSREARQAVTGATAPGTSRSGESRSDGLIASTLTESAGHHGRSSPRGDGTDNLVVGALTAAGGTARKHGHGWGQQEAESGYVIPVAGTVLPQSGGADENDAKDGRLIAAFGGNRTSGEIDVATACRAKGGSGHGDFETETFAVHAFDARQTDVCQYGDISAPLDTDGQTIGILTDGMPAIAFDTTQITSKLNYSNPKPGDACHPLAATAHPPSVVGRFGVRRLMPVECERLMGFPDGYSDITFRGKPAADGPRYKALGNSMATKVVRWIGQRIARVLNRHRAVSRKRLMNIEIIIKTDNPREMQSAGNMLAMMGECLEDEADIESLIDEPVDAPTTVSDPAAAAPAAAAAAEPEKRRRRTKAEMEAAKAGAGTATPSPVVVPPANPAPAASADNIRTNPEDRKDPAAEPAATPAAPAAPTRADLQAALKAYADKNGMAAAAAKLKELGVAKQSDIAEERFVDAIAAFSLTPAPAPAAANLFA